jgi:hypothetical protein
MGQPSFIPSEETGAKILEWCETGAEQKPVLHPELLPGTDKWATCVKGIADGAATIERIKLKNTLSEENEALLKREATLLKGEQEKANAPLNA